MVWIPQIRTMDALEPFQEFEVYDGRNQKVTIDSLHKLRKVERESEQAAANGEGQAMHWRMWSQDRSNRDVNTHGPDPSERPDPAAVRKLRGGVRREGEDGHTYGPGVTDANTSPLGHVDG